MQKKRNFSKERKDFILEALSNKEAILSFDFDKEEISNADLANAYKEKLLLELADNHELFSNKAFMNELHYANERIKRSAIQLSKQNELKIKKEILSYRYLYKLS